MNLQIEKMIYGGSGLARADGKAIFIPGTLPGELVEAAITRDKGTFAEAALLNVLTSSPQRMQPACPFYATCGGCHYQHATYPAQLAIKQAILSETLQRAGLNELPEITTHAAEPWGYRNRIRLHLDPLTHQLGYREGGSHRLLVVDQCPVAAPLLQQLLVALQPISAAHTLGNWCASLELFTNHNSSELLLNLVQRQGSPTDRATLPATLNRLSVTIAEQFPQLIGATLFAAPTHAQPAPVPRSRRGASTRRSPLPPPDAEANTHLAVWGQPWLHYQVGTTRYRVSAGAFFQGNRFLVDTLRRLATTTDTASPPAPATWDLYAGVGLFALPLAAQGGNITAVEGAPISSSDLAQNLGAAPGAKSIESSTLSFLVRNRQNPRQQPAPQHIVLDPPRAGLGPQAAQLLAAARSQSITYVSCDPATLSRDLRVLVDAGYTITQLHLVDMFPQTFHLETVVKLSLR
jgi:23S rRNA (uracil1939-C5)-methyltransferase